MELTNEMIAQIDENMEKVIAWLSENALEGESIYIGYNPSNYDYRHKFNNKIRIAAKGEVIESGEAWGYSSNYKPIMNLGSYDKLSILKQWTDIKERFIEEKNRIIEKNEIINNAIFKFEV